MTAVGGSYREADVQIFPGTVETSVTEEGWRPWQEVHGEDDWQRVGFMTAKVPLSWIRKLCIP